MQKMNETDFFIDPNDLLELNHLRNAPVEIDLYNELLKEGEQTSGLESAHLPINPLVDQAFSSIIRDLRENWRVEHPTNYELMMEMFRSRPDEDIPKEDLLPLYEESSDPENALGTALVRLNKKLESQNLRIVKFREKGYRVIFLTRATEIVYFY
jgi:hypothetical protein